MIDSLVKIYYENKRDYQRAYEERYSAGSSIHLEIKIRQYNHPNEYSAFIWYNQDLALSLERVYSAFTEFLKILPRVTESIQNQFALLSLVEEVHSTSEIEGIHSTQRELREILEGGRDKRHFSSVIRMYELLSSGEYPRFESCEDVREFYDEFAHLDAIADNPKNRLDGELFRKDGVDVRTPSGKTIHRGLEPEEKVIESLSYALRILNSKDYPALIRIALFHYLFVYIHPFYDGNGRTARFISSSYIGHHLHFLVGLRLSATIKANKSKYYRMLKETDSEKNCGDITPFIDWFINLVYETLIEMNRQLKRKLKQVDRLKRQILSVLPDDDEKQKIALSILENSVFYGLGSTMSDLMISTGRTRNTVKSKSSEMPIREIRRNRVKYYKLYWGAIKDILRKKRSRS